VAAAAAAVVLMLLLLRSVDDAVHGVLEHAFWLQ
jgi:hypothetical protein